MDKYKKIIYVVLVLIIVGIVFFIYTNASKAKETEGKTKALSEVQYMEKSLVELFNLMNNIEFQNYKISSSKLEENQSSESQGGSSGSRFFKFK